MESGVLNMILPGLGRLSLSSICRFEIQQDANIIGLTNRPRVEMRFRAPESSTAREIERVFYAIYLTVTPHIGSMAAVPFWRWGFKVWDNFAVT